MSHYKDCFLLGKITKTFGYRGEVIIFLDTDEPKKYSSLVSVLVDIQGELTPFLVSKISLKTQNSAIVLFDTINNIDEASSIVNCNLFLPLSLLPPLSGNKFYFHEVIGFSVFDKNFGYIGNVDYFYDNPGQPIMSVVENKIETLIPLIDKFIVYVDRENRIINIDAPDGLIELYR